MTVLGNTEVLAFEVSPVAPTWERRYVPERGGWASLSIWIAGRNLCEHLRAGEDRVRKALFVPLAPLADWFVRAWPAMSVEERAPEFPTGLRPFVAMSEWFERRPPTGTGEDDWFEARERWWSRHFLLSGADGAFLPNVAFVRADEVLVAAWGRTRFAGKRAPVFLSPPDQVELPWAEADAAVRELVAFVAQAVHDDTPYEWVSAQDPFVSTDAETLLARAAMYAGRPAAADLLALTGQQTADAALGVLGLSPATATEPASSTVTQVLRDLPPARPAPQVRDLIFDLATNAAAKGSGAHDGLRKRVRDGVVACDASERERQGRLGACTVREHLDLDGQPIPDLEALLADCGITIAGASPPGDGARMLVEAREGGSAALAILKSSRTDTQWGRRFELARGLGHVLLDTATAGALGAASSPHAQALRRRRSGAFAAELLIPEGGLRQATNDELDRASDPKLFRHLLVLYGVGARTLAWQLWNHGLLSTPEIRDELIEVFGAPDGPTCA